MRFPILGSLIAAFLFAAPALAEKVPEKKDDHKGEHKDDHAAKPKLFVKEGDQFREAKADELPAAAHGDAHPKKGGLSFAAPERYDLGIYTLIVFVLLFAILTKFAWPNIAAGLKKREAVILGAREEAAKSKAEAEDLRAKLQKDYAEAQDKIRAMLDEARRDSEALRTTEREAGARDAQTERDRARREIQTEKDAVLQELYQQAVQLASLLSSKTIRRELTADDHRKLLDESLAEIRTSVKA
jgi:F-type H+-transporting ATPase subunit b